MGLCKCPKRSVTNQFCFEHRVNVCEHCMVTSHPKCIVQSYIQWLKDSDYVSNCTLCGHTLENGDCIRLICYHVFHWECLNARQSGLPPTTAPGGHTCPICSNAIFPPPNLISPVADMLKSRLGQVNWGRNELGLPMLSEEFSNKSGTQGMGMSTMTKVHSSNSERNIKSNGAYFNSANNKIESPHSVLLMEAFNPPSNDSQANSRRPLLPRQSPIGGTDRDDNKYKRRTPAEIFSRWSRRFYAPSSRPPWRRTWFLVLSGILTFIIIIYLMAFFGRGLSTDSSEDSWNNNPNPVPAHFE